MVTVAHSGPGRFQAGPGVRLHHVCSNSQHRCCQAEQRREEHGPDGAENQTEQNQTEQQNQPEQRTQSSRRQTEPRLS